MDIYQILVKNDLVWSRLEAICVLLIILLTSAIAISLYMKQIIKRSQVVTIVFLIFYLLLVITATVFGRQPGKRMYKLEFLWSYKEILNGNRLILNEVVLNIMLLLPLGILLSLLLGKKLPWYVGLFFGAIISGAIEMLQLITCRGLFEFDDIFHNCIGCMIGCVLYGKAAEMHTNKREK